MFTSPKVGDRYIPASINNTPSGNPTYTLCVVSLPAQNFDWRPVVDGWCVVTGTGPNVSVDLVARLNSELGGNEVGRGPGIAGVNPPPHIMVTGPPTGSAPDYDKVSAGYPALIYFRAERQSGSDYFTTTEARTRFRVKVDPVPGFIEEGFS